MTSLQICTYAAVTYNNMCVQTHVVYNCDPGIYITTASIPTVCRGGGFAFKRWLGQDLLAKVLYLFNEV